MDIIYISRACSRNTFRTFGEMGASQASQKYNQLLAEGLVANGCKVSMLSNRPIVSKKLWIGGSTEVENGVIYNYLPICGIPLLKDIIIFFDVALSIITKPKCIALCDILNISALAGAILGCTIRKQPVVGIVTDVPGHFANSNGRSIRESINLYLSRLCTGFLLLTQQMNSIVNTTNKPAMVLEGHVDSKQDYKKIDRVISKKPRICMYAGSLMKIYGIPELVKAFVSANI